MKNSNLINEAFIHLKSGRYEKAVSLCQQVLRQEPGNGHALHLLSRVAVANSDFDAAAGHLEKAIQALPPQPELSLELGNTLRLADRPEEATQYLRPAARALQSYDSYCELGLALVAIGADEEAQETFQSALRLKPDCFVSARNLGEIARRQGQFGDAVQIFERLISLDPANPHAYAGLTETHLAQGEPAAALAACERCLEVEPAYTRAFAYKCIALSELGDDEGLRYLFDPDRFIHRIPAQCPASFRSVEEFNACLADYILNQAPLSRDSSDYSTVNGWHSEFGKLFDGNKMLGNSMHWMIRQAVDEYVTCLPNDPEHPAIKSRPSEMRLISWSVVMDYLGHETTHIHPRMWVGGPYYVKLPGDFDSQPDKNAGHVVFGQGPEELHPLRKPETITLKPAEGDFVIFPGYYWHMTVPLQSREKRICVAFDLQSTKGWGK